MARRMPSIKSPGSSPAVRAAAQPMPHHAVLAAEDEVPVVRLLLVDGGQRPHAPPRVVLRRPRVEAVPAVVGGALALRRAQGGIVPLGVEIAAVAAGVVEHAVQYHPHAPLMRPVAQGAEVLLAAQQRVDGAVVRRVVAVVAGGLENGVQVQGGHAQPAQIVQLLRDARQRAAEEVPVGDLAVDLRQENRPVAPALVEPAPSHHGGHVRHGHPTEPVGEDLIGDALAEPLRRGRVLVHRQLPAYQLLRRVLHAVFAEPNQMAVAVRQPEGVPAQVGLRRGGVCPGEAALRRRQGAHVLFSGELPVYQQLAAVIRLVLQREADVRRAGHSAEGVFIPLVS